MKHYVNAGGSVTLDTANLEKLKAAMKGFERARVKVGVLSAAPRPDAGSPDNPQSLNNAEIGLRNEYGVISLQIPERSFLRMPCIDKLPDEIQKIETKEWVELMIETGFMNTLSFLGAMAEGVIQTAFATRGFGRWAKNATYTIWKKGSSAPLIDSGELRQVITSKAVKSL